MPHPSGMISVNYEKSGKKLNATITLPKGVNGEFVWNGQVNPLKPGENKLSL